MTERTFTLPERVWHKTELDAFIEAREELGQKKYGRGKKNAAYRRDNLMDVIEELTDAMTIFEFFKERFYKVTRPTIYELPMAVQVCEIENELAALTNKVFDLRRSVGIWYPSLRKEDVKRAVPLVQG